MHMMEFRRQKCTTGRLTCLNLANSEIIPGVHFEDNARVRALIDDPGSFPVLLYPGKGSMDIRDAGFPAMIPANRRLTVFIVDATWHCSRKVVRLSPSLQRLPRLTIEPLSPSRYTIKRQPAAWCLSTLEAVHELLMALESSGMDAYPDKDRLLSAFHEMQSFQVLQTAKATARLGHCVRGVREPV